MGPNLDVLKKIRVFDNTAANIPFKCSHHRIHIQHIRNKYDKNYMFIQWLSELDPLVGVLRTRMAAWINVTGGLRFDVPSFTRVP